MPQNMVCRVIALRKIAVQNMWRAAKAILLETCEQSPADFWRFHIRVDIPPTLSNLVCWMTHNFCLPEIGKESKFD